MGVGTAGNDDGGEAFHGPALGISGKFAAAAAAPAMIMNVQVESWWAVQIGLESKGFLVLSPAIHEPPQGQFARRELHLDSGVRETTICQSELNVEARGGEPADGGYMAVSAEGGLNPREDARAPAPIELQTCPVPDPNENGPKGNVNGYVSPHPMT